MPSSHSLSAYRKKRTASATPEPFGHETAPSPSGASRRLFVVQQHAATRLHWDFRLEVQDVLCSWAVPKGPSLNPEEKRFAAQVEDHPLEYAPFEGVIPAGNYGAGSVIVWDMGTYVELEDFVTGFQDGKLLFELNGHKLRGRFTLIQLKGRDNTGKEWLLIKEQDQWVREEPPSDASILSGLTVQTLASASEMDAGLGRRLASLEPRPPETVSLDEKPMLASSHDPFHADGWVYEIKYDGYRLLIVKDGGKVTLLSRNGIDLTSRFPEIVRCADRLPYAEFMIDSEVVVLDGHGVPSFARLQHRAAVRGDLATRQAANHDPVTCYAFDILHACGYNLKGLPLLRRKAILRDMLPPAGPIRFSEHIEGDGVEAFHAMRRLGLEGIVGKRADSPYVNGRSPTWRKVRAKRTGDFVIVAWVPVKGDTKDIGALVMAEYRGDDLVLCGRVGSGLSTAWRRDIRARFAQLPEGQRIASRYDDRAYNWVSPNLVCEIEYREYSAEGSVRFPVFLRLRDDKRPQECVSAWRAPPPDAPPVEPDREIAITNRGKVFFPELGWTKGDLLDYYEAVSPWMLTYLVDRPLVLTRFPDGIHGKSFYQRDAPAFVPDWVQRKVLWSESAEREVHYFVVQNTESLVYLANMGAIPIHAWHSRITDLEHPDWCVLDLDPKSAPFTDVLATAVEVKRLLDEIALPGFLKTSGASGLHILLPLAGQLTHRQATALGELLARVIVKRRPDICTVARMVRQRENKVYIDYLQNGHGQLLVAPLSARAEPAGSVSMPVKWSELNDDLHNARFNLKNAVDWLAKHGDSMADVMTTVPDLATALDRLGPLVH